MADSIIISNTPTAPDIIISTTGSAGDGVASYATAASIPVPYTGVARVGTDLYVGDGGAVVAVGGGSTSVTLSSSNTGAVNSALIQAALDLAYTAGGGVVSVGPAGIFPISGGGTWEILNIGSNVTLNLNCELIAPSSTSAPAKNLIANKNYRGDRVTLASQISSVYVLQDNRQVVLSTATESGHTRQVGDWVYIKGDTSDKYNGAWQIYSINSTTWTFKQNGYSSAPSDSTGTIIIYKADANITITGSGNFNHNNNGTVTLNSNCAHCSLFNKTTNLTLNPNCFRNANKYLMYICNTDKVNILDGNLINNSDGVHFHGPVKNVTVGKVWCQTSDDSVAFTTSNVGYSYYDILDIDGTKSSDGNIENVVIDHVTIQSTCSRSILLGNDNGLTFKNVYINGLHLLTPVTGVLLASGSGTGIFKNINISNVSGNIGAASCLTIGSDNAAVDLDGLTVNNVIGIADGAYLGIRNSIINCGTGGNFLKNISITNVKVNLDCTGYQALVTAGTIPGSRAVFCLEQTSGVSALNKLQNLTISNVDISYTGAMSTSYRVIQISNNAIFKEISIVNSYNDAPNSGIYANNSSSTDFTYLYPSFKASNCGIGASAQAFCIFSGTQNHRLLLSNIDAEDATAAVIIYAGAAAYYLSMSNVRANNRLLTMSGGTPTVRLSEGSCLTRDGITSSTTVTAGTLYLEGACCHIAVDVGDSRIVARKGAMTYHNSAVTGRNGATQQGLAVYNGTNWYALGTGASGVNTLIV